ncbi:short-chain dehydrogenase [Lactococcus hodotermopsidis]|uniref:Short-chain dehydrogenase n=1 Tax=Pseudolactococcus hodotermopsidis TaxID=2709157 RepID=A0A6A0BD61_9LACT|nr:SDR family NAD(P)-dependent oxidoreductase [Lactococcus hodotermopsidis]GFH42394.1 short-chain dehydrogenase [Lactococcus hodotermopsidis]
MRNLLITGATGDIAREIIARVKDDYRLILLSRDVTSLAEFSEHLYQVDLTDEMALTEVCQQISDKFGVIDVLINNAGYGNFQEFLGYSADEIRQMFEVNVFALMTVTRVFLPDMIAQQSGQIINIASIASYLATAKSTIYAASKFAVRGFSDALRQEVFDYNINVLVVNTGPVLTKFHADNAAYLIKVGKNVVTAAYVADKVVASLGKQRRELNLPRQVNVARILAGIFPNTTDKITRRFFNLK